MTMIAFRFPDFPTVWEDNSPDKLRDIVVKYCLANLDVLFYYNPIIAKYELKTGITLPQEICERVVKLSMSVLQREDMGKVIRLFEDPQHTRLTELDLSGSCITDDAMAIISRHKVTKLNIDACFRLTSVSLRHIQKLENLVSLVIGSSKQIFDCNDDHSEGTEEMMEVEPHCNYIIKSPQLKKFCIEGLENASKCKYFSHSLQNMQFLTHLDLSRCRRTEGLTYLAGHKHLVSLVLFNVVDITSCIPTISTLMKLRHLDISMALANQSFFEKPSTTLRTIVENLSNLVYLDISGTNLGGPRVAEATSLPTDVVRDPRNLSERLKIARAGRKPGSELLNDIPGLESRVHNPLELIGLYNTGVDAAYRHHIPAKKIAGDANEDQILIAGQLYIKRLEVIQKVLNDLFHVFRFSDCTNTHLALDIIIQAMKIHKHEKHIQISGSASLFYVVKGEEKDSLSYRVKREVITALIDAMYNYIDELTMLRNGCLTLLHFKVPDDVFFAYERIVNLLLRIVALPEQDEFVQRIGVYLLNSLACQVNGEQKQLVGDCGGITAMLQLIAQRLATEVCDEVMETAWSTMWNVTDETPINCQRFLEENGMSLFLECLKIFPQRPELLRNMMGLLGNVAEVKELRSFLMKDEYLSVFNELLSNKSDGIEVSYNAAGILSHIASDGPGLWDRHNILVVRREKVLESMVKAIESWNLDTKRNINYRSFEPILRLLSVDHTPEAQHWAVWAMANLTNVYPEKYCSLLKEEGGLDMLHKLLMYHKSQHIIDLANMIIQQCKRFDCKYDD